MTMIKQIITVVFTTVLLGIGFYAGLNTAQYLEPAQQQTKVLKKSTKVTAAQKAFKNLNVFKEIKANPPSITN